MSNADIIEGRLETQLDHEVEKVMSGDDDIQEMRQWINELGEHISKLKLYIEDYSISEAKTHAVNKVILFMEIDQIELEQKILFFQEKVYKEV